MNDQNKEFEDIEQQPENIQQETVIEDVQDNDTTEEKARSYGHISKEEWVKQGKDPDEWKSPREFVRTGEMIEQIYDLKKQIAKRDEEISAVLKYNTRNQQRELEAQKHALEQRLQEAKEYGDVETVEKLTQHKIQYEQQMYAQQQQYLEKERVRVLNDFTERNRHWLNDDHSELKRRANDLDNEIRQQYQQQNLPLTYAELARQIETRMRMEYPDIVGQGTTPRPTISAQRSAVSRSAASYNESSYEKQMTNLSSEHKALYRAIKRDLDSQGIKYTSKDFIEKLRNDGEI